MAKFTPSPGQTLTSDGGKIIAPKVDSRGNQKVSISHPISAYGDLSTVTPTIVESFNFTYGLPNSKVLSYYSGYGGTYTSASSMLSLSSSDTLYSYAAVVGRRYTPHRPGLGTIGRFTAVFGESGSLVSQQVGMGHAEDGYFFGYNGTDFGILHRTNGQLQIQVLEVLTGSNTNETVTIVLDGTPYTSTVTNNNDRAITAYQMAVSGSWTGIWKACVVSSSIYFVQQLGTPAPKTGSFNVTASTAVTQFYALRSGSSPLNTWYPQTNWNIDKMDGTGPSGMLLDPKKGNVYQISTKNSKFGNIHFYIEDDSSGEFTPVHQIKYSNLNTTSSVADPSFAFSAAVASLGGTTPTNVKVASFSLLNYGGDNKNFKSFAHINSKSAIGTTFSNVLSLRNCAIKDSVINRTTLKIVSISIAVDGTKPAEFAIYRDPYYSSTPTFTRHDAEERESALICTTTTTVASNDEVFACALGKSEGRVIDVSDLDLILDREDTLCFAVRSTSGTTDATVAITWQVM